MEKKQQQDDKPMMPDPAETNRTPQQEKKNEPAEGSFRQATDASLVNEEEENDLTGEQATADEEDSPGNS